MSASAWLFLIVAALLAGALVVTLGPVLVRAVRTYWRMRGTRLVTCPETERTVAVDVNARKAAADAAGGRHHLRLRDCTRWPERADCPQGCVAQIESDPEGCLVWRIVQDWYDGKDCVYCRKPINPHEWLEFWLDHTPALLGEDGEPAKWTELPAELLPQQLQNSQPMCWNCYVTERFRQEHPDLVIERRRV